MQERRTPEPNRPDSDATSDETLADVEKNEKVNDSRTGSSSNSDVPSPDGAVDEPDAANDAGPM